MDTSENNIPGYVSKTEEHSSPAPACRAHGLKRAACSETARFTLNPTVTREASHDRTRAIDSFPRPPPIPETRRGPGGRRSHVVLHRRGSPRRGQGQGQHAVGLAGQQRHPGEVVAKRMGFYERKVSSSEVTPRAGPGSMAWPPSPPAGPRAASPLLQPVAGCWRVPPASRSRRSPRVTRSTPSPTSRSKGNPIREPRDMIGKTIAPSPRR